MGKSGLLYNTDEPVKGTAAVGNGSHYPELLRQVHYACTSPLLDVYPKGLKIDSELNTSTQMSMDSYSQIPASKKA